MSEYIIDLTGVPRVEGLSAADPYAVLTGIPVREQIVRCKDCKHYDEIIHACERFDCLCGQFVSYVFDADFCCWGERRREA